MKFRYFTFSILAAGFLSTAIQANELDGKWARSCSTGENGYSKKEVVFEGNKVTLTEAVSTTSTCDKTTVEVQIVSSLQIGPPSQIVAAATETEMILSSITLKFIDPSVVPYVNQMALCGYKDWVVGQTKDVAGKVCSQKPMPKVGDSFFDLYSIQNGHKMLRGKLTKEFDGSAKEKRPRELDTSNIYLKQ